MPKATKAGADGVVSPRNVLGMRFETSHLNDHPVCAFKVASQHFLVGAATPPVPELDQRVAFLVFLCRSGRAALSLRGDGGNEIRKRRLHRRQSVLDRSVQIIEKVTVSFFDLE